MCRSGEGSAGLRGRTRPAHGRRAVQNRSPPIASSDMELTPLTTLTTVTATGVTVTLHSLLAQGPAPRRCMSRNSHLDVLLVLCICTRLRTAVTSTSVLTISMSYVSSI